jgi:hypothetical protein
MNNRYKLTRMYVKRLHADYVNQTVSTAADPTHNHRMVSIQAGGVQALTKVMLFMEDLESKDGDVAARRLLGLSGAEDDDE